VGGDPGIDLPVAALLSMGESWHKQSARVPKLRRASGFIPISPILVGG